MYPYCVLGYDSSPLLKSFQKLHVNVTRRNRSIYCPLELIVTLSRDKEERREGKKITALSMFFLVTTPLIWYLIHRVIKLVY